MEPPSHLRPLPGRRRGVRSAVDPEDVLASLGDSEYTAAEAGEIDDAAALGRAQGVLRRRAGLPDDGGPVALRK